MSNSEANILADIKNGGKKQLLELLDVRIPAGIVLGVAILQLTPVAPDQLLAIGAVFVVLFRLFGLQADS